MRGTRALLIGAALVAASSAQAAGQPFGLCLLDIADSAQARGVPQPLIGAQLLGLAPDTQVLAATQNQAEFVRPVWAYLDAGAGEARAAEGRRRLEALAPLLDGIEARYGVDRFTLVAFWGVESSYGAVLDDSSVVRPALRALATLACGDPGRAAYWRDETIAALQILARGEVAPERLTGSWAGALGHTQFMPSVFLAYAVDGDGDGRRDLWSAADALASTANYLAAMGWRRGERWGAEARLPEGFDIGLADETTERSLAEWAALGVRPMRAAPGPDAARASLLLPAGARGPAFLILPNFQVILRYNTALAYALTVGHLSDRLRGEPGLARDWPRADRVLTTPERREVQALLAGRGHPVGAVDGKVGPRTRAAIRAYQAATGLPPDGYADAALLEHLRAAPSAAPLATPSTVP